RADRLADRGHALDRDVLDLPRDVRLPRPRERIKLHRLVALGDRVRRPPPPRRRVLQVARLARGLAVDPEAPTTGTAEQVVNGRAEVLAGEVPEGDLQPAERAVEVHAPALNRDIAVHHLGEMLDLQRIAAEQVRAELLGESLQGWLAPGHGVDLTPAVDSG